MKINYPFSFDLPIYCISSQFYTIYYNILKICVPKNIKPPWRNRLARSAVNRKVGGSSPPGGEILFCIVLPLILL